VDALLTLADEARRLAAVVADGTGRRAPGPT
jgi:hypothetical protein